MRSTSRLAFILGLSALSHRGPCQMRAGVRRLVDTETLTGAVGDAIDAADLSGNASLGTVLATKASVTSVNNLSAKVDGAAGLKFEPDTAEYTGSGGVDLFSAPFTLPLEPEDGKDYLFNYTFTLSDGDTPLGVVTQENGQYRYDQSLNTGAGGWVEIKKFKQTEDLVAGTLGTVGTEPFGLLANLPGVDFSDDSDVVSMVLRPRNGETVKVAIEGNVRALNDNLTIPA
jgi:hypothetical protein